MLADIASSIKTWLAAELSPGTEIGFESPGLLAAIQRRPRRAGIVNLFLYGVSEILDGVSGGSLGDDDSAGGGGSGGNGSGDGGDLAWTGASLALPVGVGVSLLVLGGLTLLVTSRRRHDPDSMLYRWWPGD